MRVLEGAIVAHQLHHPRNVVTIEHVIEIEDDPHSRFDPG
jgi:hypothetical protein